MNTIINLKFKDPILSYCLSKNEIYIIKNNSKKIDVYDYYSEKKIREIPLNDINNQNLKISTENNYILLQQNKGKNTIEINLYTVGEKQIKKITYKNEIIINHYFDKEGFAILTNKKLYFHKYMNETSTCLVYDQKFEKGLLLNNQFVYYNNKKMVSINTNNLLIKDYDLSEELIEPSLPLTIFNDSIYFFSNCELIILNKNNFKIVSRKKTDINFKIVNAPFCLSGDDLFVYDENNNKLIFVLSHKTQEIKLSSNCSLISYITSNKDKNEYSLHVLKSKFIMGKFKNVYNISSKDSIKTKNILCDGDVIMNRIRYPIKDGSKGSCLITDGKGNLSFDVIKGSGDIINNGQCDSVKIGTTNDSPVSLIENNKKMISIDKEHINLHTTTTLNKNDCQIKLNGDKYGLMELTIPFHKGFNSFISFNNTSNGWRIGMDNNGLLFDYFTNSTSNLNKTITNGNFLLSNKGNSFIKGELRIAENIQFKKSKIIIGESIIESKNQGIRLVLPKKYPTSKYEYSFINSNGEMSYKSLIDNCVMLNGQENSGNIVLGTINDGSVSIKSKNKVGLTIKNDGSVEFNSGSIKKPNICFNKSPTSGLSITDLTLNISVLGKCVSSFNKKNISLLSESVNISGNVNILGVLESNKGDIIINSDTNKTRILMPSKSETGMSAIVKKGKAYYLFHNSDCNNPVESISKNNFLGDLYVNNIRLCNGGTINGININRLLSQEVNTTSNVMFKNIKVLDTINPMKMLALPIHKYNRTSVKDPKPGFMVYNTIGGYVEVYTGKEWKRLAWV